MPNDNVNGNVNGDLISRAEAIDIVRSMTISLGGKEIFHPEAKKSVLSALDELPAVDAVPVIHARWELYGNDDDCGSSYFCTNCGAKMDLEGDT